MKAIKDPYKMAGRLYALALAAHTDNADKTGEDEKIRDEARAWAREQLNGLGINYQQIADESDALLVACDYIEKKYLAATP